MNAGAGVVLVCVGAESAPPSVKFSHSRGCSLGEKRFAPVGSRIDISKNSILRQYRRVTVAISLEVLLPHASCRCPPHG